ncbi:MAG: hypothetical protein Q8Q14_05330 [Gemmatimonadales bacterium]|nr:hypothetical protein [Gemmatimonadales bacterium]
MTEHKPPLVWSLGPAARCPRGAVLRRDGAWIAEVWAGWVDTGLRYVWRAIVGDTRYRSFDIYRAYPATPEGLAEAKADAKAWVVEQEARAT